MRMSDLSNLLGDLYRDSDQDAAPVRHEPPASERAPERASASRLEQAFDGWAPEAQNHAGTSADADLTAALTAALGSTPAAPAQAPAMPAVAAMPAPAPAPAPAMPAVAAMPAFAPEAAAPEARSTWTTSSPAAAPAPAMAPAGPRMWVRGDDDILPLGSARKKR